MNAIVKAPEDHFAGGGLQHAGNGDVDGLRDQPARVVHDNHGAVIEIGDTLVVLFAFLEDEDTHRLAGQNDRLQCVRQLVNVQHLNSMKLCDFVQVEVVRHQLARELLGELDQLHVDLANLRKVLFDDLDMQIGHFLQPLENVQPATTAVALQRIGGIGHQLQLAQHELRHSQSSVEKSCLGYVCDPAIDDYAG